ncbi:SusD/RagB family nutrient-binding outer membrane lipoprotein [Rhodohalobacter barkolensis]|uniref:SusD/RagB family nutrient-binding outer membrane lipoprotein n=1 Tax=Rhodohalobacter barkolensis TaxID=2053187 RepID=A0A2N0VFA3_9BACT|nr:SusD/RagB family nutrient-binding outer membrane lipoprotein [Rhodohalobacter barkolensis]PKD42855.1 SusD/RagB family nutrient-binding outer membrane lipoprotein [Rhodohalobacter barkolensis]
MNNLKVNFMKPIKRLMLVTLIGVSFMSCDDFGDLNDDPNNPSQVSPDQLLTDSQRNMSDVIGAVNGTLYVQYIAETQYTDAQEYRTTNASFYFWYTDPIQNLQTIIDLNTDEETRDQASALGSNANQIAVARILKAYFYQMMTDRWGMIPYSEALQGEEDFSPAYDSQEDIYEAIITELKEAADQIELSEAGVSGDILFSGDMEQWVLFANSLRARAALRIADVGGDVSVDPAAEFADAVDDGLINSDVLYPYQSNADDENPWYSRFQTRTDYAISETIADYMKGLEDDRILVYANPAPNYSNDDGVVTFDEIRGMPFLEDAGELENAEISFPGSAIGAGGPGVGDQSAPLPIITVAEMHFAMAEAVERGWITGAAADYYYDGIEASWEQWGVYDDTNFADYIAQTEVAYGTDDWDVQIGTQKWIALFPHGYEGWAEWRRLGQPELTPNQFGVGTDPQIPVRFTYPSSENTLNQENYEAAVQAQGPDSPNTRIWWDVD